MKIYESAEFFMMRSAVIPFTAYMEMDKSTDSKQALLSFYRNHQLFQEAIMIASPNLHQALSGLKSDVTDEELKKIYPSLLNYFLRMSTRVTPFGLFSSVAWGRFLDRTTLEFDFKLLKRRIKPDMAWVKSVIDFFHKQPDLVPNIYVMTNPAVIKKRDRFIFIKKNEGKNARDQISLKVTSASNAVLSLAKKPILYSRLEESLVNLFPQYDRQHAISCVKQFFQMEYLLSELTIRVDIPFKLEEWITKIKQIMPTSSELLRFEKINELLRKYEKDGGSRLEELMHHLNEWQKVEYPVHVDSYLDTEHLSLHTKIKEDLSRAATALWLLSKNEKQEPHLVKYHSLFLEKYGVNRFVPILDLLDEVKGLGFPLKEEVKREENLLMKMGLSHALKEEMVIDDFIDHLSATSEEFKSAPLSLELNCEIIASSPQDIDAGDYLLCINPVSASIQAGSLFGRFFYLWEDSKKEDFCRFLKHEEALCEDVVFVEASFLPENPRTANVCYFEKLRKFQLQMHYGEVHESLIPLDDLFVGATLSRLYIYSKTLQKEVCVTMSSAVNQDFAPPVLRFLLEISRFRYTSFSPYVWKGHAYTAPYLPRVRYQHIVLCPSRWYVDYEQLGLKKDADHQFVEKRLMEKFQTKKIPDFIYLTHADHRLLMHWKNPDHFKIICDHFMKTKELILFERIQMKSPLSSNLGTHLAEFVVPMVKKKDYKTEKDLFSIPNTESIPLPMRLPIFQKKWLFIKLFLPKDQEEDFIIKHLTSVANFLLQKGIAKKWFYVRYQDDRAHIRLRVHCSSPEEFSKVQETLSDWALDLILQEVINDFSFHLYEREVERYGGPDLIELAEDIFFADSQCCNHLLQLSAILKHIPLFALASLGMINYLIQLENDREAMIDCLSFEHDFDLLKGLREEIKGTLQLANLLFFQDQHESVDDLSQCYGLSTDALKSYRQQLDLKQTWNERKMIIQSLLHMHCNRLLGNDLLLEKKARTLALHVLNKIKLRSVCL